MNINFNIFIDKLFINKIKKKKKITNFFSLSNETFVRFQLLKSVKYLKSLWKLHSLKNINFLEIHILILNIAFI